MAERSAPRSNRSRESDADVDPLFQARPEEFVAARHELVAKLNERGEREAASEVKALARPTVPVWAINQLARREPAKVAALLEAANELRSVQKRALKKRASAEELRSAAQAEREALRALLRSAQEVLRGANRSGTSGLLGRVESTLHAHAVGSEADRELLRRGRVAREAQALGFGGLLESGGAATAAGGADAAAAERPQQRQQALAERRAALQAIKRLKAAAAKAERIAERLRGRAERLAANAAEAQGEAAKAQREAAAAQHEVAEARRRLDDAVRKSGQIAGLPG